VDLVELKKLWNNDPSLPFRLAWELWRRRIELVHTHSWGTLLEGVVAAKLARTPVIIHGEHGILETRPRNVRLQRTIWAKTHQLTAVASPLADDMANLTRTPRDQIRVIPNGVDTDRFFPRPELRSVARQSLGLSQSDVLIGMVARLVPVKNHRGVLEAIEALVKAGMPISLALAGDGPLRSELQRLADDLGLTQRVHFLGNVGNIEHFFNSLDLFILNSHSEGMSNTLMEAMASGLAVIATAVGPNPDLVVEGETGLVVPPNAQAALARAISELVADKSLRERMGRQGRVRVERFCGIDKMVQDYSDLYEELCRKFVPAARSAEDAAPRWKRTDLETELT
jgi:glycosyltransferase involved in cell wall biosynthesis